ncbi:PREDICTED: flap endonuclease 1-like [Acropora digitifera]|uniref:flap endonuclease 1-like n=1 Tax=Acropora digitifera TaxID=70779 RepID=UPI00077AA2A9|nr:PREDICTED: flap endonuclease 1-like [Acropora digitifera]
MSEAYQTDQFLAGQVEVVRIQQTKMGIHGLAKVIGDHAPSGMKENEIKNYFGKNDLVYGFSFFFPFSHLMGMFYRTIRMVENGIKPVFVFDGKPPHMKSGEVKGFFHSSFYITIYYLSVYASGTEDMDALTFGSSVLLRHLTFSEARKSPIQEFYLDKILMELKLSQEEFIDLCILLGCDYCDSIKGIGPKRAMELIRQYKSIEEIIKHIDTKKYTLPEEWPYQEARELFKNPEVLNVEEVELKWETPNEEELVKFLVQEKGFSEERIRSGIKKLQKARQSSTQGRLDSFFKVLPITPSPANKRKSEDTKGSKAKKSKVAARGKPKTPK